MNYGINFKIAVAQSVVLFLISESKTMLHIGIYKNVNAL